MQGYLAANIPGTWVFLSFARGRRGNAEELIAGEAKASSSSRASNAFIMALLETSLVALVPWALGRAVEQRRSYCRAERMAEEVDRDKGHTQQYSRARP